jgi:hypothetical protein
MLSKNVDIFRYNEINQFFDITYSVLVIYPYGKTS